MLSESDLHRLVTDISNRTAQATAATQQRVASSRHLMAMDADRKAVTEQAVATSAETLDRARD